MHWHFPGEKSPALELAEVSSTRRCGIGWLPAPAEHGQRINYTVPPQKVHTVPSRHLKPKAPEREQFLLATLEYAFPGKPMEGQVQVKPWN